MWVSLPLTDKHLSQWFVLFSAFRVKSLNHIQRWSFIKDAYLIRNRTAHIWNWRNKQISMANGKKSSHSAVRKSISELIRRGHTPLIWLNCLRFFIGMASVAHSLQFKVDRNLFLFSWQSTNIMATAFSFSRLFSLCFFLSASKAPKQSPHINYLADLLCIYVLCTFVYLCKQAKWLNRKFPRRSEYIGRDEAKKNCL